MAKKQNNYDWLVKVLIIGDSGVGKTNVLLRFCQNTFNPSHLATIGIDFKIKTVESDGKKIRMQIWDTAGQERFKTITQTYYKGSAGIVLAYSVTDRNSFTNIENWMKQIKSHVSDKVVKVLIANKCDSQDRVVSQAEGKELAEKFGVGFFQTSAKQSTNIQPAFDLLIRQIKQKLLVTGQIKAQPSSHGAGSTPQGGSTKLKGDKKSQQKKGCNC